MPHRLIVNGQEEHDLPGGMDPVNLLSNITNAVSGGDVVTIDLGEGQGLVLNGRAVVTAKVVERVESVAGAAPVSLEGPPAAT